MSSRQLNVGPKCWRDWGHSLYYWSLYYHQDLHLCDVYFWWASCPLLMVHWICFKNYEKPQTWWLVRLFVCGCSKHGTLHSEMTLVASKAEIQALKESLIFSKKCFKIQNRNAIPIHIFCTVHLYSIHVQTALRRTDLFMEPSHKTPGQGAAYPAGRWGWRTRCTRTEDNTGPDSDFPRKDSALGCLGTFSEFHQPLLIISCLVLFCFFFIHFFTRLEDS